MKKLLLLLFLSPLLGFAQHNYFVNDGYLHTLTPTPDSTYLGITYGKELVKVDSMFNFIWGLDGFEDGIQDFDFTATGNYLILSKDSASFILRELDTSGTVVDERVLLTGAAHKGELEVLTDGFGFAFVAYEDSLATERTLVTMKTDFNLNVQWTNLLENLSTDPYQHVRLEQHYDTLTVLAQASSWGGSHSFLIQYDPSGNLNWFRHLGTECSSYVDFGRLSDGHFVLVGERNGDETEALKVTVTNALGIILSTKEKSFSGSDSGSNQARVSILSDDRYVVSNNYWEGPGSGYEGRLLYFDNHKPVAGWQYSPQAIPDDDVEFGLWNVDWNDRLLISGHTESYSELTEEWTVGRLRWTLDYCSIGAANNYSFIYRKDTTETINITPTTHPMSWLSRTSALTPAVYSNVYGCQSNGVPSQPSVTTDHLYGVSSWGGMCEFSPYGYVDTSGTGAGLLAKKMEFSVYPNPSDGLLNVKMDDSFKYQLLNSLGQVVQSGLGHNGITQIQLPVQTGVYFLKLEAGEELEVLRVIRN